MKELLVYGIKEMYRNHPMPNLPNFKLVSWKDKELLDSADIYIQHNILGQKRKSLNKYYQYILDQTNHMDCLQNPHLLLP